jgi:hypothetical protein
VKECGLLSSRKLANYFTGTSSHIPRQEDSYEYIVAYLLKTRTVEPEKQPLLATGSETTFVSRQRHGKHVPAASDTHTTKRYVGNGVFYSACAKGL